MEQMETGKPEVFSDNGAAGGLPVIEVRELTRRFGLVTAVDAVSFDVREGEIFGFLGPNGAGKTTTINMLCTLLRPTAGRATVNGHDVTIEPHAVRQSIGLIFQDPALDERLTAYENLRFHAMLYDVPPDAFERRVREVLQMVDLADKARAIVRNFSGGMKRRLEIARGLLHHPKVLFLDEPTIGLDPQTRRHIWEYITALRKQQGLTIFLTTHYMEEAEICERIAIIDHGRIVALDTPDELKRLVGGDVVTVRTGNNAAAAERLKSAFGLEPRLGPGGELIVEVDRGDRFIPQMVTAFNGDGAALSVHSVSLRQPGRGGEPGGPDAGAPGHVGAEVGERRAKGEDARRRHDAVVEGCGGVNSFRRELKGIYTIWYRDVLRFLRDRSRIVASLGQPLLFLFVFGSGLAPAMSNLGQGAFNFKQFLFPGILSMAVLFTAIFSAVSIVWDREFGFLKEVMVAPVSRLAVALGKVAGGSTVAMFQGLIVLVLAPFIGVRLSWDQVLILMLLMLLLAAVMTAFGILIAARQRSMEGFQMVMQFLLMPMFFLSGAFFPLRGVPLWMEWLSRIDPVTYGVDPLRQVALGKSLPEFVLKAISLHPVAVDVAVLAALGLAFLVPAVWLFGRQE
ncbi:MAG: ABC transporter permease [Bacillota bacterium]